MEQVNWESTPIDLTGMADEDPTRMRVAVMATSSTTGWRLYLCTQGQATEFEM